jgi:hypothetical protein
VFELAISLLAVPVLWAMAQWRLALLLCLATAILQDPLRKLTPDQPVLFVVFVGVVFGAGCLGALARGIRFNPNVLFKRFPRLIMPLALLPLLLIVQAINSYLRSENLWVPALGLMTYVLPLFSIIFAYQLVFRQGEFRIDQFMKWYVVCISLVLLTIYLEYSGYDWPVLGQVGEKLIMYDRSTGAILFSYTGLLRASEISAWHAMTAACFVVLMTVLKRTTFTRLLTSVIVVVLLLGLGALTGRRKLVIEFGVFVSTYLILWLIFEKRAGKLAIVAVTTAAVGGYLFLGSVLREPVPTQFTETAFADYSAYVGRTQSAFGDAPSRFVELGLAPVMWAYDSFGFLGAGLGMGTQGTQHFGGGAEAAAEGGLGKITLELGIPGLFLMGWVAILAFRHLFGIMRTASRHSLRIGRLSFGLFSFLVANVAGFSVATQAYSDFFILLILSWTLGFLFAVPVLVEREVRAREPKIFEGPPSLLRPKILVSSRI